MLGCDVYLVQFCAILQSSSAVTTELCISLGWTTGKDTGCAACRRAEERCNVNNTHTYLVLIFCGITDEHDGCVWWWLIPRCNYSWSVIRAVMALLYILRLSCPFRCLRESVWYACNTPLSHDSPLPSPYCWIFHLLLDVVSKLSIQFELRYIEIEIRYIEISKFDTSYQTRFSIHPSPGIPVLFSW